ncbi:PDDEXK nuclease domain-containing protein [Algoriphagus hitonicola]|uniref:Predicted nuclease of restriction endonuclease-like (RecB) superfamily, DUF1016 family n=1 Tax=Algoriphagus hitonicola TaxID=435880 RepID=A0A1I2Q472_9BACT|nr:PDDEXK nuclease domain-containing protein [Algoriphagus hitonicola]SFG23088.1 Predicted nuclease of restriction endonuclease-like (RecB) superfamily, DUF1016 family [Algoriphagus hitonicola]
MEKDYKRLLSLFKEQIKIAQIRTVTAANKEMLLLYWKMGKLILYHQSTKGWGAQIIKRLSEDLKKEFPNQKGFSPRNLNYIRKFSLEYSLPILLKLNEASSKMCLKNPSQLSMQSILFDFLQQAVAQIEDSHNQDDKILQQAVAEIDESPFYESILSKISRSHHVILLDKEPHLGKRLWYMHYVLEEGLSRNILAMQIESGLFERQVSTKKINNFKRTLPPVNSDYANYFMKDPYIFDFVQASEKADERNVEEQLATHVTNFLLELGKGFAFVGKQVHFEVGGDDFYADLVFYHTRLKCFVVVELKAREFRPGDASQLNFYVNVANDFLKSDEDNETIGLLLCKGKNNVVAEYSLKGLSNALGVSNYQTSKIIPDELQSELPQLETIEKEFKNK